MGVEVNAFKLDHICCFKCHNDNEEMYMARIEEIENRQKELENYNQNLKNENELFRLKEKDIKEKEEELNKKEEKINKKFFDLKEAQKEKEKEKEVFRTDSVKLHFENNNIKKTINASKDYNYKGEVLNQRIEQTYLQKENQNNLLGYSNNNKGNVMDEIFKKAGAKIKNNNRQKYLLGNSNNNNYNYYNNNNYNNYNNNPYDSYYNNYDYSNII